MRTGTVALASARAEVRRARAYAQHIYNSEPRGSQAWEYARMTINAASRATRRIDRATKDATAGTGGK